MVVHTELENLINLNLTLLNDYWELVKLYKFSFRIDKDGNRLPETWNPVEVLIDVTKDIADLVQKYRDASD